MVGLIGCSEFRNDINLKKQEGFLGSKLTYDYETPGKSTAPKYFKDEYTNASAADKKAVRNRILFELVGVVDADYNNFEMSLRSDRAYKDTIAQIASLALSGVGVTAGASAARTLAAVDTGLKGANSTIDAEVFRDKASEFLINTMRANRSDVLTKIYQGMHKEDNVYPLEAGINDIVKYYHEGTVTSALVSLAGKLSAQAETSKGVEDQARNNLLGVQAISIQDGAAAGKEN